MAKTHGDKIDELSQLTATLTARLDTLNRDIAAIIAKDLKTDDLLNDIKTKLAVIEERLNELKKGIEETGRRKWSVVPSLVGAIVGGVLGGVLGFFGQFLMRLIYH